MEMVKPREPKSEVPLRKFSIRKEIHDEKSNGPTVCHRRIGHVLCHAGTGNRRGGTVVSGTESAGPVPDGGRKEHGAVTRALFVGTPGTGMQPPTRRPGSESRRAAFVFFAAIW
jgi:hypothetical protein